jgi:hypothetical protein
MAIDADLILRQAKDIQRVELEPTRAAELADETAGLIENALAASQAAAFEDHPDEFTRLLRELRDAGP